MTKRRRALWMVTTLVAAAIVAWLSVHGMMRRRETGDRVELPSPRGGPPSSSIVRADFVGAERCATCHAVQYAAWKVSTHGRAGGAPTVDRVIAAFDGREIRLADAVVIARVRAGTYEFVIRQPDHAERIFRVDGVVGGGHLAGGGTQGFISKFGDGTLRFLPFDWSRQANTWFCNTNSRTGNGWVPITSSLKLNDCGDWPPIRVLGDLVRYANCQSCHASQASVRLDTLARRFDTNVGSLAINCESCHGPGRRHADLAARGGLDASADIGMVSLATLDKDASSRVCYQCHAVKDQLHDGFLSGAPLARYYSLKLPLLGDRPLQPDGRVRTFAYQEGQQFSDCYLNGGMTCTSCHDPHSQHYRDVNGVPLTGRFDDRQCTSCHVSKADRVIEHSHHRAGSPGSRCTACHMPYRQEPETESADPRSHAVRAPVVARIVYARADHSVSIPRPARDSAMGVTSACGQCHPGTSVADQERQARSWWGEMKPVKRIIADQQTFHPGLGLAQAASLLLGTSNDTIDDRHSFARFAGMSRFLESYITPDMDLEESVVRRLTQLATAPDQDVRAIALASLHLARGRDIDVRRVLAHSLLAAGTDDESLRARWTVVLGFMGDRFASSGDARSAIASYLRALEVQSSNARLLVNLANVQRDAGDLASAVTTYQRSLGVDPDAPLTWVNLGIALGAAGDTAHAIDALTRATALNAGEPLAWYNLANISFLRGDLASAEQMYRRTVALDESIALADFQLARIDLFKRDAATALRDLRHGLAFDSSDASARDMARTLANQLGDLTRRR